MASGIVSGMSPAEKVRENRLRRVAGRRGLTLQRSRRRDVRALDYGLYWLIDQTGIPATDRAGVTLEEAERFLQ
jgi:hypothetical protein